MRHAVACGHALTLPSCMNAAPLTLERFLLGRLMSPSRAKCLRDEQVRDILWQVSATIAPGRSSCSFLRAQCLAPTWSRRASPPASISCGATAGIEVPFNAHRLHAASDTILALLWVGIVNTLLVSAVLDRGRDGARLHRRSAAAHRATGCSRRLPAPTSSPCAISRCCSSCCSGISACSPPCPAPRESFRFLDVAFLNRRGLSIPAAQRRTGASVSRCWPSACCSSCNWASRAGPAPARRAPAATRRSGSSASRCSAPCPSRRSRAAGALDRWDVPALRGFNYRGGFVLVPEFVALFAALSTYTAGFIAEVVRGGILSVPAGPD